MTTERRKLNPQELAECAALKAEIAAHNAKAQSGKKLTQEVLAQELGMTQGNLSSHLNGKRAISKEMAAKAALLLGIQVEAFSQRLAREITQMAQAVGQASGRDEVVERSENYQASPKVTDAFAMFDRVTPRSQAVLRRIAELEAEGRLADEDIKIIEQIIERFSAAK